MHRNCKQTTTTKNNANAHVSRRTCCIFRFAVRSVIDNQFLFNWTLLVVRVSLAVDFLSPTLNVPQNQTTI